MTEECWDVDLLVGREPSTAVRVTPEDLAQWASGAGIRGGILGSLRAVHFNASSGNDEARRVAEGLRHVIPGLVPAVTLETRDWLGARAILRQTPPGSVVRLAPERQDCQPAHPGFRAIITECVEREMVILCEGDLRRWGPALAGRGAVVVFLDAHFYHLGDLVALFSEEPGFHTSTRLLNGPDSLEIVRDELGVERLVFGSRAGLHEGASALARLRTSTLSPADRAAVAAGNLRRLLGVDQEADLS